MTDKEKLEKVAAYLVRRMYAHNQMADIGSTGEIFDEKIENAKYEECRDTLNYIDSMQEEPQVKESAKIQHVNKTCKENSDSLTQEPVSEDLEEATINYCVNVRKGYPRVMDETDRYICNAFKAGANWQKERIMANSTNATIGLPYENRYGGYTHLIDVSRPLSVGNNIIAIIFKED